jgi:hypothetical protein
VSGRKDSLTPKVRKNHLLVISIDKYENCPTLFNCVKDGESFTRLLGDHFRFNENSIQFIKDHDATQANIIKAFRKLALTMTEYDNLVIFFSGHGVYDEILDEGYWIPADAVLGNNGDYISNSEIVKFVKAIRAHHIVLIIDSCFSGTLAEYKGLTGVERVENLPSRWVITSGRKEPVLDGKPGDHSPFSEGILDFLNLHKDSRALVSDLIQYVKTVVANNMEQIPLGSPLYGVGDKGGEYIFHSIQDLPPRIKEGSPDSKIIISKNKPESPQSTLKRIFKEKWVLLILIIITGIGILSYLPSFINNSGSSYSDTDLEFFFSDGGKIGFRTSGKKVVIPPIYDNATHFVDGLAAVSRGDNYGFINKNNETVIEFKYDHAMPFGNGLAPVKLNGKYGYINTIGQLIIPHQFESVEVFSNGTADVSLDGKTFFMIDIEGRKIEETIQ